MNETFKEQLTAFAKNVKAICKEQLCCEGCPLGTGDTKPCAANYNNFNADKAIAAVEAYRKRKKPCAEVIDRAVDIYTIEVEVRMEGYECDLRSVDKCAEHLKQGVWQYYGCNSDAAIRVLSAKRFVLESHKESHREEEN